MCVCVCKYAASEACARACVCVCVCVERICGMCVVCIQHLMSQSVTYSVREATACTIDTNSSLCKIGITGYR